MLAAYLICTLPTLDQQGAKPPQTKPAKETPAQKAERIHKEDLKRDAELGAKYSAEADKEYKFSTKQDYIDRVQRIGKTLAEIANKTPIEVTWGDKRLNPFNYTFKVIQGDDVNAFSLPGGTIYVFEGLVEQSESDDELAGVLAHEIAHASERHVATLQSKQSKMQAITLPLILLGLLTGGASAAAGTFAVGGLISQATGSGWSVEAEESADYGGFQYLLKSPYDPTGMLTFMERLARKNQLSDAIDWGIYRSHPPSRERAITLTSYMNKSKVPIRRSRVAASFRTTVLDAIGGAYELRYSGKALTTLAGPNAKERATAAADNINAFFDSGPELFELKKAADGRITGSGRTLLQVTEADAIAANLSIADTQTAAFKALQIALYATGQKVWERSAG